MSVGILSHFRNLRQPVSVLVHPFRNTFPEAVKSALPMPKYSTGSASGASVSKFWVLHYHGDRKDIKRMEPWRESHFALVGEYVGRGEILLSGVTGQPGQPPTSAMILFRGASIEIPQSFIARDPYVKEGIVSRTEILEFTSFTGTWNAKDPFNEQ